MCAGNVVLQRSTGATGGGGGGGEEGEGGEGGGEGGDGGEVTGAEGGGQGGGRPTGCSPRHDWERLGLGTFFKGATLFMFYKAQSELQFR